MDRVMAATVFNHICDLGSLSAAARALGLSRPMVSRYLDEMEKWTGARLIHRSSRRLTITPAGEEALVKPGPWHSFRVISVPPDSRKPHRARYG